MLWFYAFVVIVVGCDLVLSNTLKCERINVSVCEGLGYNTTSMPNFIGHEDQREATFAVS